MVDLHDVKKARQKERMNQEELAVKLHVVRQTILKCENGRSVPDADVLIKMAAILGKTVPKLLGIEFTDSEIDNITEELAHLNAKVSEIKRAETIQKQVNQKRGLIIMLSIVAMLIMQ